MAAYVAFLRGIMPSNPNMRNEKLRGVFEGLGFSDVRTVISSGNVIFESKSKSVPALEAKVEKALMKDLGIKSPAYVRSKKELESLIKKDPFKGSEHGKESYLIVTFLKKKPREIFSVLDMRDPNTSDFMRILEKKHGKDITTRTWKTVERIMQKI